MSELSVQIIEDADALATLKPEWRSLWLRSPHSTPFQNPDWLMSWWDIFAPGDLRLIAVRSAGALVGLAPLYREVGVHGRRLLPMGIGLSDYVDILVRPEYDRATAKQVGRAIGDIVDVEQCEFSELPPDSNAHLIPIPPAWEMLSATASNCPVLRLPSAPQGVRDTIPPSRLRHLKTARNRAAKCGETAIIEGDADNAHALFRELVRLHTLRWQDGGQGGVFADSRVSEFHVAALPGLMGQDLVRLYALSVGRDTVAVYYGFLHEDRAYAYMCGYDPGFAFVSPGAILIGHAIEEALRGGAREFHFLRGGEAYKYEWGAEDRFNATRTLVRTDRTRRRA